MRAYSSQHQGLSLLLIASLFWGVGCSAKARFYPVQGPLAKVDKPPVLEGKVTLHPHARTLTMQVMMANGEPASGTAVTVFPPAKNAVAPIEPLAAQWDVVYGDGAYVATVLGQGEDLRGIVKGSRGSTLNVEIHYNPGADNTLQGVAEDDHGTVYKIGLYR